MSWDVIVQNFRGQPPDDDGLGAEPEVLGTAATIRKRINKHLGGVVWSDLLHGIFEGQDFSIEFDIGDEKPISAIMLSVRGSGDAFAALKSFAVPNQWSLFDCTESTFLDLGGPTAKGFDEFQKFRDRAIPKKWRQLAISTAAKTRSPAKQKAASTAKGKRKPQKAERQKKAGKRRK